MNIKTRLALLALMGSAPCACQAVPVDYPRSPAAWSVVPAPVVGSDDLQRANSSLCPWKVSLRGGRPQVALGLIGPASGRARHSPLPFKISAGGGAGGDRAFLGEQLTARVDDGWLVGFNAGEFGASLWWFSPDGHRRYKVSDDQVNEFLHTPTGLVALQGLAHLSLSDGGVVRLTKTAQGRWRSTVLAPLGDAPEAAALDVDGTLVVIGARKLTRVAPTGRVRVLARDAAWGVLYPDSMVRVGAGEFYVGMRGDLVHIMTTAARTRIEWLLPSRTFLATGPSFFSP